MPVTEKRIHIRGKMRWMKAGEKDYLGGVEVLQESDKKKLVELVKATQGL